MPTDDADPVVQLRGVSKRFPGAVVVKGVDLDVYAREVHVIAGENGAGKSTLMKLMSQVERPNEGEVKIAGQPVKFQGPAHAQSLGVAMVYQEFALAPDLSVAENLSLGREPGHRGIIARGEENASAEDLLQRVHLDVEPKRKVSRLTVAEQQRVEIAKALAINAKVLIMDEPTSTLTGKEIDDLFEIIEKLKSDGIAILYITHKLDEIFRIADRITVMRDAEVVDTLPANELDEDKLISLMVGREVENLGASGPDNPCEAQDLALMQFERAVVQDPKTRAPSDQDQLAKGRHRRRDRLPDRGSEARGPRDGAARTTIGPRASSRVSRSIQNRSSLTNRRLRVTTTSH